MVSHRVSFVPVLSSVTEAAEVAYDQMLQEDFEHPITWLLSWYACHLHWQNPPVPVVEEEEGKGEEARAEDEEEEEEVHWMGFTVCVRFAGQKYGPTCHQRNCANVTEFVTLVRLSSLGQHVGVLALAGYKRRKSALTAGPIALCSDSRL